MLPRNVTGSRAVPGGRNVFEDLRQALAHAGPDLPVHRTWTGICRLLQERLGSSRFAAWIRHVAHVALDDRTLTVTFSGRRIRSQSQAELLEAVTACARAATQSPIRVVFAVGAPGEKHAGAATPPDEGIPSPRTVEALRAHDAAAAERPPALREFLPGPHIDLAVKAIRSYVTAARVEFAPLLLHGAPGCGKTRLLELAAEVARDQGRLRGVLHVGAEEFSQQYTFALQRGKLAAFQQKYRSVDLLLLDDAHRLAYKEATQDEFLHTFDALEQSGRRVVATALWPGRELPGLHPRLRARMKSGLEVRIALPGTESRRAALARWNRDRSRPLPVEPLERLAQRITGSLETLWRAFDCAAGRRVSTAAHADEVIALTPGAVSREITLRDIAAIVAARYDLRPEDLRNADRGRRISTARQICFTLARRLTPHALQEIGAYFGGRNRATVLAGIGRVRERQAVDPILRTLLEESAQALASGSGNPPPPAHG